MPEDYKRVWSTVRVTDAADEKPPELATNDTWRGIMARARKDHDLSQQQLADKLGSTQAAVSKIESGEIRSSTLVIPICTLLQIPLPEYLANEEDRRWHQIGRALRHRSPEMAKRIAALCESLADAAELETGDMPPVPSKKP